MHQFSDSLIAPAFLRLHSSYLLGDLIWQTIRVERIQKAIHSDSPFHRLKKTSQKSPHSTEFLSLQTQGLKTKQHRKRKDNFSSYFFTFRNREYNFVFPFNPIPIIIWDFVFFSSPLWFQRSFRLKKISCFSFFINLSLRTLWREKKLHAQTMEQKTSTTDSMWKSWNFLIFLLAKIRDENRVWNKISCDDDAQRMRRTWKSVFRWLFFYVIFVMQFLLHVAKSCLNSKMQANTENTDQNENHTKLRYSLTIFPLSFYFFHFLSCSV